MSSTKKSERLTTKISPVAPTLAELKKGHRLIKCRGSSGRYPRMFRVAEDCCSVGYTDSHKADCMKGDDDASKIMVKDVGEIREGPKTDVFVKQFPKLSVEAEQCFSLVVGERHKTLDLVAPSPQVKEKWVKGLRHLIKKFGESDLATKQELWMRELFKVADKNGDGALNLKEISGLLKHLNIEVDHDTAKVVFEMANTNKVRNKKGEECLDIDEFIHFYQIITKRDEVENLFESYNDEGKYLDAAELQHFFEKEQNQTLTREECEGLIDISEPCPNVKAMKMMSMDGFNNLLSSPVMDVFDPKCNAIYMDMTRPMAHYFIDSSHNTYLTADQLVGPSAVEAYIRALKRGCRCVELDCWDGSEGEPVIYHGHTFTSKILFKDVIVAINEYAFEMSEYPVILSIENHCSVEQQRKMAQYMVAILGEKLVKEPLSADCKELPTPEHYKNRILIKAKKCSKKKRPNNKAKRLPEDEEEEEEGYVSDEDEAADLDDATVQAEVKEKKKEEKHKLAKELSDLVIICISVSFKNFVHALEHYTFKQMSSYGESKASSLAEVEGGDWVKHNVRQLSRVYPGGRRTDSSNYDPVPMWCAGNQIVALNYQTPDEPMQTLQGMFRDNGGCGYVLKPDYMNKADTTFDPNGPFPEEWKKKLTLTIISGYQLPKKKGDKTKNILDPYVKVEVMGVKADCDTKKTEVVPNNGFHPVWTEELEFDVNCPDLAIVHFRVMDHEDRRSNKMVAQYALRFSCMQPGYRTVHLKTKYGEPIWGCQLFIHVKIT